MSDVEAKPKLPVAAIVGLVFILIFNVLWRWHTIGPIPLLGFLEGSIIRSGETEPLDCDEALYAYMGHRINDGAAMYRDLTENKPPLGYWLFALADKLGGYTELTFRVMPIVYVSASIIFVWWIGLMLRGGFAACLASLLFSIASCDPYVFGNGSNMEHFLNCFSLGSLAFAVKYAITPHRKFALIAGIFLGLAALIKPFALTHGLVFASVLAVPSRPNRLVDLGALAAGFLLPCVISLLVLVAQGSVRDAYADIVLYAAALASDVPPDLKAPPRLIRLVTGNADPAGILPWPFGKTDYLVWWGAGLWPLWLCSVPATIRLFWRGSTTPRRLVGAFTLSCWLQVFAPGQFWQHYYMLVVPGASLTVALWFVDAITGLKARNKLSVIVAIALIAALSWTLRIQVRDYMQKTPDEITSQFKGGRQWVELRKLSREIARRKDIWQSPKFFLWGWQSNLYFYANLDGVSRQLFVNDLLKNHANDYHPVAAPRIAEMIRDVSANPPALIFCGYPPFPELHAFLKEHYLPSRLGPTSPNGLGLWVEIEKYGAFESHP